MLQRGTMGRWQIVLLRVAGREKLANRDFSSRREIHRREGTSREPRNDGATMAAQRWQRCERVYVVCGGGVEYSFVFI